MRRLADEKLPVIPHGEAQRPACDMLPIFHGAVSGVLFLNPTVRGADVEKGAGGIYGYVLRLPYFPLAKLRSALKEGVARVDTFTPGERPRGSATESMGAAFITWE